MSTEPLPDLLAESSIAGDSHTASEVVMTTSTHAPIATDPVLAEPVPAEPVLAEIVVPTTVPHRGEEVSVGRYTQAELQAMVGKRGRKPPEFYQMFPRSAEAEAPKAPSSGVKKTRTARASSLPAVSSAVIGEHTIDELLAMIGSTGRKPVAFEILQQSAQVFADAKAIDLPPVSVDPLVTAFAAAPKSVREAIMALLAATSKR